MIQSTAYELPPVACNLFMPKTVAVECKAKVVTPNVTGCRAWGGHSPVPHDVRIAVHMARCSHGSPHGRQIDTLFQASRRPAIWRFQQVRQLEVPQAIGHPAGYSETLNMLKPHNQTVPHKIYGQRLLNSTFHLGQLPRNFMGGSCGPSRRSWGHAV